MEVELLQRGRRKDKLDGTTRVWMEGDYQTVGLVREARGRRQLRKVRLTFYWTQGESC